MKWKLHSQITRPESSAVSGGSRINLFRKVALVVTLAVSGSIMVAAPAFAASTVCTRFPNGSGNILCIATANLMDGTAVTGNSASNFRNITLADQNFGVNGREVYRLVFAGTSMCVGLSSTGNATIRDCLGNQNNTNWEAVINSDSSVTWLNHTYTSGCIGGCALTSSENGGTQLFGAASGSTGFQKWTPQPQP